MTQSVSEAMATQAASNEASPSSSVLEKGLDRKDVGFVVGWEGKSDPGDPLNTPHKRRWYVLCRSGP
jgi:hypothetical protein